MSDIKHHIRLLHGTALHDVGSILGVTHNHHHAAGNNQLVHHDHAHELVKTGKAEWVGIAPGAAPAPEAHQDLTNRHAEEHADMLSRHATEHRELKERHEAEHRAAIAALGMASAVTGL